MGGLGAGRPLETGWILAGILLLAAYAVDVWLGTIAPIPAGIGLVTIAVGLVGLGIDGADRPQTGGMAPESMCFIAPILLLHLPSAALGGPPWRLTFLVLGTAACVFSILLVGVAHRSALGGE